MQALIDFTGWRKWRGYADSPQSGLAPTGKGSGAVTSPMQDGEALGIPNEAVSPSARKTADARGNAQQRPSAAVIPGEAGESGTSGSSDDTLDTLGTSPPRTVHGDIDVGGGGG